jgi:diguanylate cyclase (GGDEF)-like protein
MGGFAMSESVQQKMHHLQALYRQQLPQRLDEVESLLAQVQLTKDNELAQQLLRLLHNMAGSGATFGLPKITEVARKLENTLQEVLKDVSGKHMDLTATKVNDDLKLLRDVASGVSETIASMLTVTDRELPVLGNDNRRLIYLVDDDEAVGKAIALQIHYFGYDVRGFTCIADMAAAIKKEQPAVIIMDMEFPEGQHFGAQAMAEIQNRLDTPIPVIYLTEHKEFESRLVAIRAGCSGYFTKPVEVSQLIDYLDGMMSPVIDNPYRVMVVDDNVSLAEFHALTLRQAGMNALVVTDPALSLHKLEDFSPELILIDMYMPKCGGDELAQIIRQHPEFVSIPIVYLSGELDLSKQLAAMRHGGDDFLTKPINSEHLVASVSIRAERYRNLRSYMIRDGLTGLLNHSRIEEELNIELSRAIRENKPLAFVMVDLDHFKSVNDTYGHAVGDRVLKSLARLLKDRLRKTDRIGRYGGEEFAVILPNTEQADAVEVMNSVREDFSKIVHHADDDREFIVTMSCGIACLQGNHQLPDISKLADDALYEAKRSGRNRVVVAK